MTHDNYLFRKKQFMKAFDKSLEFAKLTVSSWLGEEKTNRYSCAIDKPVSELMGWGLTRLKTLAGGYPKCEFRFKKGSKTNVPIPSSL